MKKWILAVAAAVLVMGFLSPMICQLGWWRTVHRWEAPEGTFGASGMVSLEVQTFQGIFDPLNIFGDSRLVLFDGVRDHRVQVDLNFFPPVSESVVEWEADGVCVTFPSGVSVGIPVERGGS